MLAFNQLATIFVQKYERYLPTAFDGSLTLLEKVNKIIEFMNLISETVNEFGENVVTEINGQTLVIEELRKDVDDFKASVEGQLLPENLEITLNEWFDNGKLSTLINEQVFDGMKQDQEQTDYVEILKKYNSFHSMQIQRIFSGNAIEVTMYNDLKHITMQFLYNSDEYMVHTRTWEGNYVMAFKAYDLIFANEITKQGTYLEPTDTLIGYTTQVGASWSCPITVSKDGDSIIVKSHTDNRGGIWEYSLSGLTNKKQISLYSATSGKKEQTIFENVDAGDYTLSATFIGDDPLNPPSTGSGTSRGWLNSLNDAFIRPSRMFAVPEIADVNLMKEPSNLDFAYYFKPVTASDYQFVPFHGYSTAVKADELKMYDGVKIIDFDSMADGAYENVDEFCIEQNVYAVHPETPTLNQLQIFTRQTVTKDGMLKVDGKMNVLRDTLFTNSYVLMSVAKSDKFDEVVSSFGNSYPNNASLWLVGERTFLVDESDRASSYLFLSSFNKNLAIASRVNNIRESWMKYSDDKDAPENRTYIQHRDEKTLKIYSKLFDSTDNLVLAGTIHRFSGDYIFTNSRNVYDILSKT